MPGLVGHSQDSHLTDDPTSLTSRFYSNEPSENSNITEVVRGISNQTNEIQENTDNFWIGKWIIFLKSKSKFRL